MHSNASFTLSCRVKESSLYKHVSLFTHKTPSLWFVTLLVFTFNLIDKDAVFVDYWTQNEIVSLLLHQFVAVSANLIEAHRCADPENSFPGTSPCQTVVQLVSKLQTWLVVFIVRIVVQVSAGEASKVAQSLQILIDALTYCKDEEINWNLSVRKIRCLILEYHVARCKLIACVGLCLLLRLQFWHPLNGLCDLEDEHSASDVLADCVCALDGWHQGLLLRTVHWILKVVWEVV